ncbi:MAG: hypothetical protein GF384_06930, partial [Elusimicrobia bacterium]|nr:hypothetical protein [Elusimicrobiota bacterium]MBD3412428.1 hypothetical protein [Elusimicrobiota bacterium]
MINRYCINCALLLLACVYGQVRANPRINVATTIAPYQEFISEVGKEHVSVSVLIPPGANPHAFDPKPSTIKQLKDVMLYIAVGSGIDFEQVWLPKILSSHPSITVIDSSQNIPELNIQQSEHDEHEHHDHKDPHVWLSPKNAIHIVRSIQ